ncbi:sensor domain-containing protein [Noviherbaspirillum aerium]|uniref:sensor domain-containing protein n=1 Tax=Noviherbaspirillum aerium TaxID=2588497 RepID=UPI00124C99A9|nr:EAL domain-containing protein [Noviherbaspirillum aerium]
MVENSIDVLCALNATGEIQRINTACLQMWGYQSEELQQCRLSDLVHAEERKAVEQAMLSLQRNAPCETSHVTLQARFLRKGGQPVPTLLRARWSESDKTYYCVAHEVSRHEPVWGRHPATQADEAHERLRSLFEYHPDGVFAFNLEGALIAANPAFSALTGYAHDELLSMRYQTLVSPESRKMAKERFIAASKGHASSFESAGLRKDGTRYDAALTAIPMMVGSRIVGVHGIARDITQLKSRERYIERLATHDSLTGLPNRNLLDDRIKHAVVQAERSGRRVAVLFIDLNRFKVVNDSLGHDKGDILLCIIADRLRQCVREADTVARIGGDEFAIVLEEVSMPESVITIAKHVLAAIERPVRLEGHQLVVSGSVGCSLFPKDGSDAAALLHNADLAMYEAKAAGGGALRLYKADMDERAKSRLTHEHDLRRALEQDELVVYYQPRVDISSKAIVGAEALVRWIHPERGLVPPNEFIPLAEEIGLISQLGEWVLMQACKQNRSWQKAGLPPLKVSVNLSPLQLDPDSTITEAVMQALERTGLDAKWLELEITETSLMQNVESTLTKLEEIRNAGVSISIDDFGTGYSSLSYLRRLPVNGLKIDQSFIRDITASRDDEAIVAATIALAHTMNLTVVAEGVTTEEQIRFLHANECDEVQGFLFGAAVPPEELGQLLMQAPHSRRTVH